MQGAGRCFSLSVPARDLGEAGFRVCGYMGLDSMGSSLMETQKLSFEEQPDAKVKSGAPWGCGDPPRAGAGLSPASPRTLRCHTLPILGMSQLFPPSHDPPLPLCQPVVACAAIQAAQRSPSFSGTISQVDSPVAAKICTVPSALALSPDEQSCCLSQNESLVFIRR